MTPIKVGRYTVRLIWTSRDLTAGYVVTDPYGGWVQGSNARWIHRTLPMALRVAAEAAGIERQRVTAQVMTAEDLRYDGTPGESYDVLQYVTTGPDGYARFYDAITEAFATANTVARERYAALGGAA